MNKLNPTARTLINRFQGGFPLSERPYSQVAAKLGVAEVTLTHLLRDLLDAGYLSRFGPLYDASRLGGGLTLAAMAVPEPRFDAIAASINALPEVAHNYRREHVLNMWFVVATETSDALPLVLRQIEQITDLKVYSFPKEREFYLGLWLDLGEDGHVGTISVSGSRTVDERQELNQLDRQIIAATQAGLPLEEDPYALLASRLGVTSDMLLERMKRMLSSGVIRRVGAIPNHYRLGLRGNGMSVWDVPDDEVDVLGERIGRLDFVSHCYRRPRYPGVWPYNLFAMVHGQDRLEVMTKTEQLATLMDGHYRSSDVLFSSAVLKKSGLRLAA